MSDWTVKYFGPNYNAPFDYLIDRLYHPPTGAISVDTETISLKDKTCIGIGIGINPQEAYYITVLPQTSPIIKSILGLISNPNLTKIYHNATYDLDVLSSLFNTLYSLPINSPKWPCVSNVEDTSLYLQCQGYPTTLDVASKDAINFSNNLSIPGLLQDAKDKGIKRPTMLDVEPGLTAEKCANDCKATYGLWEHFRKGMALNKNYRVDKKILEIIQKIQRVGIALDQDVVQAYHQSFTEEALQYQDLFKQKYGVNLGANGQTNDTRRFLASRGNVLPLTESGKSLRVDNEVLSKLKDPVATIILRYRELQKANSTYIEPYLGRERAYTRFRQDLSTGRLASYNRNLQNIPPKLRNIFSPDSGTFTWADLSQIEMRIFAYLSQDPVLLEAYRTGQDVHWITQSTLWPGSKRTDESTRTRAKTFNFALIYDAHESELAVNTGLGVNECKEYKGKWKGLYSGGAHWMEEQKAKFGDTIEDTIFSRTMRLPEIDHRGLKHVNNCKINYQVQGAAAGLIKRAMIKCWDIGLDDRYMRLQVHDELVFDGDIEFPVDELSEIIPGLHTPWGVKKGPKWIK